MRKERGPRRGPGAVPLLRLSYAEPIPLGSLRWKGLWKMELLPLLGGRIRAYLAPAPSRVEAALAVIAARNSGARLYAGNRYRGLVSRAEHCPDRAAEGVFLGCLPPRGSTVIFAAGVDARRLPRSLARVEARSIGAGVYAAYAKLGGRFARSYFRLEGLEPVPLRSICPRFLAAARAELGERVALRDLVDWVSHSLGLGRGEARMLIETLAERLCIVIEGREALLLD